MKDGTRDLAVNTLEIAKRDDCFSTLLPSDVRRVCKVLINKIDKLKECKAMLINIQYWDSCPEVYKERIEKLIGKGE